jgi:hypothetical protein
MGRKRSIHSDISIDAKVSDLAVHGPLPLLLYTWAIPHADDWGRLLGEPKQFKLLVCPALDVSAAEIEEALNQIAEVGLWYRYQVDGKWYIAFPEDAWFKHQTYINANKRENDSKSKIPAPPKNAAKHQETTKNAAKDQKVAGNVPSPSPSPSPTPTPTPTKTKNKKDLSGESAAGLSAEFEEWWEGYPRKDAKKEGHQAQGREPRGPLSCQGRLRQVRQIPGDGEAVHAAGKDLSRSERAMAGLAQGAPGVGTVGGTGHRCGFCG